MWGYLFAVSPQTNNPTLLHRTLVFDMSITYLVVVVVLFVSAIIMVLDVNRMMSSRQRRMMGSYHRISTIRWRG